jgi:hypothetical protein
LDARTDIMADIGNGQRRADHGIGSRSTKDHADGSIRAAERRWWKKRLAAAAASLQEQATTPGAIGQRVQCHHAEDQVARHDCAAGNAGRSLVVLHHVVPPTELVDDEEDAIARLRLPQGAGRPGSLWRLQAASITSKQHPCHTS